ncbi:pentapeptide repeat-containing protein [Ruminococcus sp.]|uniref:pentapeptide repeat-containing protein n=1 Tax=Ruminococcus sp. TaxID=41978 RepID=UPI0025F91F49|nr:pentapeptide repeat-containing protein [Ruminococcus sp.]
MVDEEKENFWNMIVVAISLIPDICKEIPEIGGKFSGIVGTIVEGKKVLKSIKKHKEFYNDIDSKLQETVPESIDKNNTQLIFHAIIQYLRNSNKRISYYCLNNKEDEFVEDLFIACERSIITFTPKLEKDLRQLLSNLTELIFKHILLLTNKNDILEDIINSFRDSLKVQNELITRQETIENRVIVLESDVSDLRKSQRSVLVKTSADNLEYLNSFYNPLFLEKDNSKVTLSSMYVSPHINLNKQSAANCIMEWFKTKRTINPCMLLYGNAGVGKSSLVSKIIADINTEDGEKEFDFKNDCVLAIALRNHYDLIDMAKKAEAILMDLFSGYSFEELKSKLLILDGLDEICVLKHGFNGHGFLEKMSQLKIGFHVLITSREADSYFSNPSDIYKLRIEQLQWNEKDIEKWCKKYYAIRREKETWCMQFIKDYNDLKKKDKKDQRTEVLCVPIILYICANSEVSISDHNSIVSIYNNAFRILLQRRHIDGQGDNTDLIQEDKISNIITWQYTKELAYQMFLLDTLDLVESNCPNNKNVIGLKNAQSRTKSFLKEKYNLEIHDEDLEIKKELALCPFMKENEKGGITFAHKTVCDYFTAVKLYEDYFAKFNKKYFSLKCNSEAEHKRKTKEAYDVMQSIIEAFRYKMVPGPIINYLNEMNQVPFAESFDNNSNGFDFEGFVATFIEAMEQHLPAIMVLPKPIPEYLYLFNSWIDNSIYKQLGRSFGCLTHFLTGHGFKNECKNTECMKLGLLVNGSEISVNFNGWHFENAYLFGAYFDGADLNNAIFDNAVLSNSNMLGAELNEADLLFADLIDANLYGAELVNADLRYSYLWNANLREADLQYADLREADLRGADLRDTNLEEAILDGAKYCIIKNSETLFPEDFDPKSHNMIEVDEEGYPIH